jgi:colanic acid biosynthesis glycosyl transferase WcaI
MGRILLVCTYYPPEPSGIAPYAAGMAEELVARGHSVTVLTGVPHFPRWEVWPAYRGPGPWTETLNGVRLVRRRHRVPTRQSAAQRVRYEASVLWTGLGRRGIGGADAVIGVVPTLAAGLLARVHAARRRVPYGLIFQDLIGPAAVQSGIRGGGASWVRRLASLAERWATSRATAVAGVSRAFLPYLAGLGVRDDRLVHLPNWSHLPPARHATEVSRARLGWPSDTQVVLHAGNMGFKQDLGQVIAAARVARGRARPIRFVLLGDGSQRAELEAEARDLPEISFQAGLPDPEYADALAAADVLLLTERPTVLDMALPSKLTSYLSSGRPVLAAVHPGGATAEEVRRSGGGIIVPAGDPNTLVDALDALAGDPAMVEGLVAAGRRYAAEMLDEARALDRAAAFVERLLAAGRVSAGADQLAAL